MTLFAIDLDGTWTEDPVLFNAFVIALRERGHDAIIVTARNREDNTDFDRYEFPRDIKIFCTGGEPKRAYLRKVHNIDPDVWIDDAPEMIVANLLDGISDEELFDGDPLDGIADEEFLESS